MKKILFLGGLGYNTDNLGGQITKNRILVDYLKKRNFLREKDIVDTLNADNRLISFSIKFLSKIIFNRYEKILLSVPTPGALNFLAFFSIFKKILKSDIVYLVIGGSLPERIQNDKRIKKRLNNCELICPETKYAVDYLKEIGLKKSVQIPNFKDYNFFPKRHLLGDKLQLVFFSRVCIEKGVELAIGAASDLSREYNIRLDIFGPIKKEYNRKFDSLLKSSFNVEYKGVLEPNTNKTYEVLSQYDLMLFPTLFENEGFAGAIIDSFISGVPVLSSDWYNGREIIDEGKTGFFFEMGNKKELEEKLIYIIENKEILKEMRKNCVEEAKKYHVDNVIPKLLKEMSINV